MSSEGYLLCAFGDENYFKLAVRAVENIRSFDKERGICILTDNVEYFTELTSQNIILKTFDYKNHLFPQINYSTSWSKFGLTPKLFQSYYSPFDITMFLDVDNLFLSNFTHFFSIFRESKQPVLLPGLSDENNRAPSDWHWRTIDEVMYYMQLYVPQIFSTVILYNKEIVPIIHRIIPFIMANLTNWRVKQWHCDDSHNDEIFYSILCGIYGFRISIEIYDWLLKPENCEPFNKTV